MALFEIKDNRVKKLKVISQKYEKDIQKLFEENLEEIINVKFLASEYSTSWGGRIDTLGIDKNGAPVIIEYKLKQNSNVINQAVSYLRWLLDHKADFEKLCEDKKVDIKIDWESPRLICVAESFNKFDLDTAALLPFKVELLRYAIHENNILQVEVENYEAGPKIKIEREMAGKKTVKQSFSLDDHLRGKPENIREIFSVLREMIISLDKNIREEPKAKYIAYKLTTNFADIVVLPSALKIFLNMKSGTLNDPWNIARDLTKPRPVGHWGNGDYEIKLSSGENIDKVFELIKQSYEYNR